MYALEGEELWYADFNNNRAVERQPSFLNHATYRERTYETAVSDQQLCRDGLKKLRCAMKDIPLENGKEK